MGARSGAWSSRNTRERLNTFRSALRNFGSALPPALLGRSRSERAPGLRSGGGGALPVTMDGSAFEDRYRVTARGHLGGDRKNCAKGRSTGFGCRRDHCVLQVPVQLNLNTVLRSE
jgi:hypothetical protein